MIKAPKYAVVINGNPMTDYIYDDVIDMTNTIFGIEEINGVVKTIHAYEKGTGKVLFKKEKIACHETADDCLIIGYEDGRTYIYFDLEKKIRGPFASVDVNHNKSVMVVSKLIRDENKEAKKVYGMYATDLSEDSLRLNIKYDAISLELDNLIEFVYKGYVGVADYYGDILFAPKYNAIDKYFGGSILDLYSPERKTSTLIDEYGDLICKLDTKYSIDADEEMNLLFVEQNGKYGVYTDEGFEIFPIAFDDFWIDRDVVIMRMGNNKFAYIPEVDVTISADCYKYTKTGKLKYYYQKRWRMVK